MIVVVCAGGPAEELCDFTPYVGRDDVHFIGADRGAAYLLERGIVPAQIVGDFDSVQADEWTQLQAVVPYIDRVAAEKDETDTELALALALEAKPETIVLTGVTGGRLDHYEAAMRAVCELQQRHPHIAYRIVNATNELRFLTPGKHRLTSVAKRYVSFFAYNGDVQHVTLRGVKYETTAETITRNSARFTSNEIVSNEAYIEFTAGLCMMIASEDND